MHARPLSGRRRMASSPRFPPNQNAHTIPTDEDRRGVVVRAAALQVKSLCRGDLHVLAGGCPPATHPDSTASSRQSASDGTGQNGSEITPRSQSGCVSFLAGTHSRLTCRWLKLRPPCFSLLAPPHACPARQSLEPHRPHPLAGHRRSERPGERRACLRKSSAGSATALSTRCGLRGGVAPVVSLPPLPPLRIYLRLSLPPVTL